MMLTEAAKTMPEHISKVIVLDPNQNCSASLVGAEQIIADFKEKASKFPGVIQLFHMAGNRMMIFIFRYFFRIVKHKYIKNNSR